MEEEMAVNKTKSPKRAIHFDDDDGEIEPTPKSKKRKMKETPDDQEEGQKDKSANEESVPASAEEPANESGDVLDLGINLFIDKKFRDPIKLKEMMKKKDKERRKKRKLRKRQEKLANKSDAEKETVSPKENELEYPLSDAPEAIAERQKLKLEKRLQRQSEEDLRSQKAVQYLTTFENDRSSWKFNKNTNIFLQKYCLDPQRVPDSHFPILLEYFRNAKGNSLSNIKDIASSNLALKKDNEDEESKKLLKRAQQVVSLFE